ncbi:MAG: hypothetical protein IJ411_05675, partial [Oscillospiraceae bacterium]|nr:hypothetical protein [Oscillospiraceae bacterium]
MKQLTKIGLALCLAGVLLCLAGWASGADIGAMLNSDTLDIEYNDDFIDIDVDEDAVGMVIKESMESWNGTSTIQTTSPSKELAFDGFHSIYAELGATDLQIEPGEDYTMTIQGGSGHSFSYKVEVNVLLLKEKEDKISDLETCRLILT